MANLEVVKEKTSSEKTRIDNIHKELMAENKIEKRNFKDTVL